MVSSGSNSSTGELTRFRRLTAALLVPATIMVGGYVAGTEGEGTANQPVAGALTLGTLVWAVTVRAGLTYVTIPEREQTPALVPEPA